MVQRPSGFDVHFASPTWRVLSPLQSKNAVQPLNRSSKRYTPYVSRNGVGAKVGLGDGKGVGFPEGAGVGSGEGDGVG